MKIQTKFQLWLMGLLLISLVVIFVITTSLLAAGLEKDAKTRTAKEAAVNADGIASFMRSYQGIAGTLKDICQGFENMENPRTMIIFNLGAILNSNPELASIWTIWEPNGVDGADNVHQIAVVQGSGNETGRFAFRSIRTPGGVKTVYIPETEVNLPSYEATKNAKSECISEPFEFTNTENNNEKTTVVSFTYPITDSNDEFVGVLGIDLPIEAFQHDIEEIKPYPGAEAALISNQGIIVAHHDKTLIGTTFKALSEDVTPKVLESILNGKEVSFDGISEITKRPVIEELSPVRPGDVTTPWSLMIRVPTLSVIESSNLSSLSTFIAIAFIVITLLLNFMILIINKVLLKPLATAVDILNDISEGEGDLTRRMEITSKDEMGALSRSFNTFSDKLSTIIVNIRGTVEELKFSARELATAMEENAAAVNQITANVASIQGQTSNQGQSFQKVSDSVGGIIKNIQSLNQRIDHQSQEVSHSSASVEEMIANIRNVAQALDQSAARFGDLVQASEQGQNMVQDVNTLIQGISEKSMALIEANGVIDNIAQQTNLLAMNAAIEAAHAGEAGKGFAVVADEIRKLAEDSGTQSQTISSEISVITENISEAALRAQSVEEAFSRISKDIVQLFQTVNELKAAMAEQADGTKQVLESLQSVREVTSDIQSASEGMQKSSVSINTEITNLASITQEVEGGMREIGLGINDINTAIQGVRTMAENTDYHVERVADEIGRFKVDKQAPKKA